MVGDGVLGQLGALVGAGAEQVLVVHSASLADLAADVERQLLAAGKAVVLATVPDGEAAKTLDVAAALWSVLGRRAFTRSDVVVGLGGGAVTDLAGYVAAGWLRGVRVVQVPTTLLGMVDAAVGGKTGVNTAEGKNLVGAFHPPSGVLCDLAALTTLPTAELVSGMAEVVKAGLVADPRILEVVEAARAPRVLEPGAEALREVVERSIRVKADVVSQDLREAGRREILNYGHTLGHAIEKVEGFRWRHGEAVSVGHGVRGGAGPRGRPAGRRRRGAAPRPARRARPADSLPPPAGGPSCSPPCGWTRRPAARCCGSSSSTGSAGPAGSTALTRTCWRTCSGRCPS